MDKLIVVVLFELQAWCCDEKFAYELEIGKNGIESAQ